jgi:hypothetical protein
LTFFSPSCSPSSSHFSLKKQRIEEKIRAEEEEEVLTFATSPLRTEIDQKLSNVDALVAITIQSLEDSGKYMSVGSIDWKFPNKHSSSSLPSPLCYDLTLKTPYQNVRTCSFSFSSSSSLYF